MNCTNYKFQLLSQGEVDFIIDPSDLQSHLQVCDSCREFALTAKAIDQCLNENRVSETNPLFTHQVMSIIQELAKNNERNSDEIKLNSSAGTRIAGFIHTLWPYAAAILIGFLSSWFIVNNYSNESFSDSELLQEFLAVSDFNLEYIEQNLLD